MTTTTGQPTTRELEVLDLVSHGMSNAAIAEHLVLSPLTVKSHLMRLSQRYGVGDRAGLASLALRKGWIR